MIFVQLVEGTWHIYVEVGIDPLAISRSALIRMLDKPTVALLGEQWMIEAIHRLMEEFQEERPDNKIIKETIHVLCVS